MIDISKIKKLLFLTLFFDEEGFAFRYPMNVFFNKNIDKDYISKKWLEYDSNDGLVQLYLHSVFCATRCSYCNCYTNSINGNKYNDYKKYILDNITFYSKLVKKDLSSIYFGGGTFSLWNINEMKEITSLILDNFKLSKKYIWQVEIHPVSITKEKLIYLKSVGVNNIMLGIQTFSKQINNLNNRIFIDGKIDQVINWLIELKFEKISFDMMYNIPHSTENILIDDLNMIVKYGNHIKKSGIKVNLEINRWDPSYRTTYLFEYLKNNKSTKLIDFFNDYMNKSIKMTKIVDDYIENKFLGLFDTEREEIEVKRQNNSAILGIGSSASSYIPGILAYEDLTSNYDFNNINFYGYDLKSFDNENYLFLHNLRRGINQDLFKNVLQNNKNEIFDYIKLIKNKFEKINGKIFLNANTDYDVDLINFMIIGKDNIDLIFPLLLEKWEKLGFTLDDLDKNLDSYLRFYYERNKLYG